MQIIEKTKRGHLDVLFRLELIAKALRRCIRITVKVHVGDAERGSGVCQQRGGKQGADAETCQKGDLIRPPLSDWVIFYCGALVLICLVLLFHAIYVINSGVSEKKAKHRQYQRHAR